MESLRLRDTQIEIERRRYTHIEQATEKEGREAFSDANPLPIVFSSTSSFFFFFFFQTYKLLLQLGQVLSRGFRTLQAS